MKNLTIAVLAMAFLISCDKDPKTCVTTTASVAGTYKLTACSYKASASAPETDYLSTIFPDACERDDIIVLNANGTYQYKDIGAACSPSGDDSGTWSVSGNILIIDGWPVEIETFDCAKLKFYEQDNIVPGDRLTITWTRQ